MPITSVCDTNKLPKTLVLCTQLDVRRGRPSVGDKHAFVVQHFVEFAWGSMTKRTELSPTVPRGQTNDGTDFGKRELRRACCQPGSQIQTIWPARPPEVTFVKGRNGKQCVQKMLITLFITHCVDQLQTDVFAGQNVQRAFGTNLVKNTVVTLGESPSCIRTHVRERTMGPIGQTFAAHFVNTNATCHPELGASNLLVTFGEQEEETPKPLHRHQRRLGCTNDARRQSEKVGDQTIANTKIKCPPDHLAHLPQEYSSKHFQLRHVSQKMLAVTF